MQLTIRLANLPQDYPAIAAVLEAENPGCLAPAEGLAYADATRDPRHYHATIVAEGPSGEAPLLIGVAFVGHDHWPALKIERGFHGTQGVPGGFMLIFIREDPPDLPNPRSIFIPCHDQNLC